MIQEQPSIAWIIGAYDTCGHGCVHCCAATDQETASRAPAATDAAAPSLSAPLRQP